MGAGSKVAYTEELKSFAMQLASLDPRAYELVRKAFLNCLPCVSTISRTLAKKSCDPGILFYVVDKISILGDEFREEQKANNSNKELLFNLTYDEIHIKTWDKNNWNFQTQEWMGTVDTGGQLNDWDDSGNPKFASKAFVLMLVCLNKHFKAPVAYYLVDSLDARDKSKLVRELLIELYSKKIKVVSVTFDGDSAQISACNHLGANLDIFDNNFQPYFYHPLSEEKIFIFYDPCHMAKLVRNYIALKGPLFYKNSQNLVQTIDWKFIKFLHNFQVEKGVVAANKINTRHIFFQREKMKVKLAVQVLSRSVYCALTLLSSNTKFEKYNQFKGSEPTAQFCKYFNDMFDMLNVRTKFHPYEHKRSISSSDLTKVLEKSNLYIAYIKKLEIDIKTKIFYKKENEIPKNALYDSKNISTLE